jgi:hypothetical protein
MQMPRPNPTLGYAAIGAVALACVGIASTVRAGDEQTGSVAPISRARCDDMAKHNVIRPGVPVGCARLSLVKFAYVDFGGRAHGDGEIVVMDAAAENVLRIFARLREIRFPIAKARLIDHYDGNDDASIADNNTSAFNARNVAGTSSLSLHAYGLAIDLNPIQNPYVQHSGGKVLFSPPAAVEYANRKKARAGMAESVVDVFAAEGFVVWGGYWHDPIDYQHFQVGRGFAERLARLSAAQARAAFAQHVDRYRACRRNAAPESSRAKCIALDAATGRAGN